MALCEWDDELSVGNAFIDNDHKKLINLVNDFHEAMEESRSNAVIGKVLSALILYTKEHFKREEDEMHRIKYPKVLEHQQEHDKLIKKINGLQLDFNNGKAMLSIEASKFLRDWLFTHILLTDKLLAENIQKVATSTISALIVDDNEMTRTLLRSILSGNGYKVLGEAANSKNGLEQALKLKPDVVCLDILMPDGSGIDVLKQLARVLPNTAVLMVTGKRDVETVKESLANGAQGFIVKPFNTDIVLKVVREAVQRATRSKQRGA